MKYSFYRIFRLWRSAAKMYGLVIVEMAVGTALLVTCLNMVFSNQDRLAQSKADMAQDRVTITWYGTAEDDPWTEIKETAETTEEGYVRIYEGQEGWDYEEPFPIDYEDYNIVLDAFGQDLIFYFGAFQKYDFWKDDSSENGVDLWYMFVNDELFADTFSFQREKDKIYVGAAAMDIYSEMENEHREWADAFKYPARDGKIWLSPDFGAQYVPVPDKGAPEYMDLMSYKSPYLPEKDYVASFRIPLENAVILPIEMFPYRQLSSLLNPYNTLVVSYRDADSVNNQVPELLSRLSQLRPGISFEINDAYLEAEKSIADQQNMITMLTGASATVMIIVFVSMIGILLVLLARRRKSIAVTYCCGATRWKSFWELAAEAALVFILGGALGLAGAFAAVPLLRGELYRIDFYPVNIITILAAAIAAALVSCLIALAGIRLREPARELKAL